MKLDDYDFADEINLSSGITKEKEDFFGFTKRVTKIDDEGIFRKKRGTYISFEFSDDVDEEKFCQEIIATLKKMSKKKKNKLVLCFGIGNEQYISDALGPKTIRKLHPTCHLKEGKKMYGLSAMIPGVMAETGLESARTALAIIKEYNVDFVVAIDSLVTHKEERLFRVIQLTDTGLTPGSGILSFRKSLTQEYLGIPVLAIGVAISSRALEESFIERMENLSENAHLKSYLKNNLTKKMSYYTPKDTEEMIEALSDILSYCINEAFG